MSDLWMFIGILIFIFVVWVATGGPTRPISFAGPYITPIAAPGVGGEGYGATGTSTRSAGSGFGWQRYSGTSSSNVSVDRTIGRAQDQIEDLQRDIVSSVRFGTPSPYKDQVTLSGSTGYLKSTDPGVERLTIRASSAARAGIDITGWRIESEAVGHSLRIPEGVVLPRSGTVNGAVPIVLAPGDSAIITLGTSPVGMSFKENACTGYLDQFQSFTPALRRACPAPMSDFDRFYLGDPNGLDACRAYVKNVNRCEIPLDEPTGLGADCQRFVYQYFTYNGCVDAHRGDRDFTGNEWRIYLDQEDEFFTKTHDTIKLLDAQGRTVDLVSY